MAEEKTLMVTLVVTKRHTNLHLMDFSTRRELTIRDAGVIPDFQRLINYVRNNGEMKKVSTSFFTLKGKMRKWNFVQYRLFMKNVDILQLLPPNYFGEVKKVIDLCK